MVGNSARNRPVPITLGDMQRVALFQGLSRTLSAGLNAAQALNALRGNDAPAIDAALARAATLVGSGTALMLALDRNGLISPHDRPLLTLAENNGALGAACDQLAQRYQRAHARWRQLKGKLLLPAVVLILAIIVLPLPALVGGTLSIGDYMLRTVASLLLLAALAQLLAMLIRHWRTHGTPGWLTSLARLLPIVGAMSKLHQRTDAIERLALALRCGSAANEALQMMIRAEHNPLRKRTLNASRQAVANGAPLSVALNDASLLDAAGFAIVSTSEGAGRLDDGLQRVAANDHDDLDSRYSVIAQWLPVFVYVCVAGVVLAGLLG
jgi:type II secretory pathway component PulF